MSDRIRIALDALDEAVADELADREALRQEAANLAANAATETNKLREVITSQQATLAAAAAENVRLARELAAGGSGLPTLQPGDKPKANTRYLLPQTPTPATWLIDVPGVEVIGTGAPVWPAGGALFNVKAGGDDFTATRVLFECPFADVDEQGKYKLPDCITTVALRTTARAPVIRRVNTFCKAMPGADGTLIDTPDAEGFSAYILYAGGGHRSVIRGGRIAAGKVESPLRATSEQGNVPDGFSLIVVDVAATFAKMAADLRHVLNAAVIGCTLRQALRPNGDIWPVVRFGDSDEPGCQRFTFAGNTIYTGQLHAKAKASGVVYGNGFLGLDPTRHVFINFDKDAAVTLAENVGWLSAAVPPNAKKLPVGAEWKQQA